MINRVTCLFHEAALHNIKGSNHQVEEKIESALFRDVTVANDPTLPLLKFMKAEPCSRWELKVE